LWILFSISGWLPRHRTRSHEVTMDFQLGLVDRERNAGNIGTALP